MQIFATFVQTCLYKAIHHKLKLMSQILKATRQQAKLIHTQTHIVCNPIRYLFTIHICILLYSYSFFKEIHQ